MRTEGTTQTTCTICPAPAEALKLEAEEITDEDGYVTGLAPVAHPICRACASDWYDGSETYPGTLPLN
jgi:hypothetical protein